MYRQLKLLIKAHKESLINKEAQRILTEQEKSRTKEGLTITKEELINIAKD